MISREYDYSRSVTTVSLTLRKERAFQKHFVGQKDRKWELLLQTVHFCNA